MKYFLVFLFIINPLTDLDKIARINKAKKEAEKAYLAKDYTLANAKYLYIKDSLGVSDENLLLNLANTQYLLNDTTNARASYSSLKDSPDKSISSIALQQLGAMQFQDKKYEEALSSYKSALKVDASNSDARYNYELLKKLIKEQEEQEKQQNKDQENKDQKDEEQKDEEQKDQDKQEQQDQEQKEKEDQEQKEQDQQEKEEQEKTDEQKEEKQKPEDQESDEEKENKPQSIDEEKLKEMKITEEKARLILEAMKNNEIQYIQQNKRKAKKKKDPNKPDW